MKKNIKTLAALLMAGAAFAACSSSDDIIENQQPANNGKQAYTLTINASKDGAATRALIDDNGAIEASWETTDVIYVTKGGTEIGTLSPTDISGLTATFTGTISGDAQIDVSDVLTLTYHPVADFATQNGTLSGSANSAENYDMAVATLTISEITGNTITVSESQANFVNQTAVVVLSPYNSSWSEYHSLNSLTVSVTMDIPEVGTVTEKIGPITVTGDQPHYFSLPSQSLLAEVLAAKYSVSASTFTTLLASATITFTGHQTGDDYDREYLTCSKTGYKFAAGKYYKLDNSNFSMTFLYKRAVADKDVYVESQDVSWSHTVTFAVNKEIGWKVVGDYVFCGDKQLYVVDNSGPEPSEGWVKASDDHIPFDATYTLEDPVPTLADLFTDGAVVGISVKNTYDTYTVTGTYSGGSYTSITKSSNDIQEVTMTKDGNNLVVWIKGDTNSECTLTFNTQDNTYMKSLKAGTGAAVWDLSEFVSITVNGTDITSTLTEAAPAETTVTWDFSQLSGTAGTGYENGGVKLEACDGEISFDYNQLNAWGNGITITNTLGKKFTSIVINGTEYGVGIFGGGWSNAENNSSATWTGNSESVYIEEASTASGITSIVFTLEDAPAPALLQVTVHESDWSQGSGDHIIYYASGETWAEAIANHPTENAGWSVSDNFVYYNGYQVYDGSAAVMADNPIENGHYEF